ncbi:MAG: chromosome segregation protein SMC [Anaerolineales bacterium]
MSSLRLRSLELNGYKTFASRTLFEFAGPITAIVGPNGSGKSNISDALRWVLGEQSYSVLRGRKTEDMIFSGSEQRARSGMASVTITFDNSEGWLPIDFAEVSVTRRAYRDGQNEYLVNQQKTRLKDVTELLAKSALAERTYSVIGQGLVDTALTLRSDERRRLFEEAAGIGLYRARKEQSLRRLEATLRNLERAEDILTELRPRVRSLAKQAERAEEYSHLRSELRETLRHWYGFHWHLAQGELQERRQEAESQEEKLGLARQKQAELSRELNELRARAQSLRSQIGEWQRRLAELNANREQASKNLAVATERERALKERRQALAEEEQRLEAELKSMQARLAEAEQDAERYKVEVGEAQGQLEEARQLLDERQSVDEGRRAKEQEARDRVVLIERQLNEAKARREQLGARIERIRVELTELQRTSDGLESDAKTLGQQSHDASDGRSRAEKGLAQVRLDQQQIEGEIDQTRSKLAEADQKRRDIQNGVARLQAEMKALQEAEFALAGFALGAKLLQEAAKEKVLSLEKGLLGREIRVAAEFEAAIGAALGTYADAVVLAEEKDSEVALDWLEGKDASAALLPLSALQADGRLDVISQDGYVGIAADLVETPEDLRPAVELLLGRVLVARDRAAARRLLSKVPGAAQVVTLRGEVFHRAGPIEVRSPKSATGLARPREERELRSRLEEATRSLANIEGEIARLIAGMDDLVTREKAKHAELDGAQVALEDARQVEQRARLESEQLGRQMEWFFTQKRSQEAEATEAQSQLEELAASEKSLGEQLEVARKVLEQELDAAVHFPMDEQRAQVAHWEMRQAVAQRALQEVQRRVAERQAGLQRTESHLAAHKERSAELEKLTAELGAGKAQAGQQQDTFSEEIDSIRQKLTPAEGELAEADSLLDRQQAVEAEALQALSSAERAHTQAQISLGRQQESLEGLRSRIEDDFGLVAFQYEAGVSGPTPLPLGELVEQLPVVETLPAELEEALKQQRVQIRRLGSVNPEAQTEYSQVKARVESMEEQVHDLRAAEGDLKKVIAELDLLMEKEFRITFDQVAAEFREIFSRLFSGGSAKLLLTDEGDMAVTGIDIEARLPGKRSQRLALLSGGERSLTAAALVFALLKASPTPFCVMDEVDAMLDEANVGRFTDLLRELSQATQFVLITHNRGTVQAADVIYGVTMGRDTASQVISLKLDEVSERYTQ